MREFVAEQYLSAAAPSANVKLAGVARRAAEELSCEGTQVRFVRSIFIPEDETCFHFYLAESAEAVQVAAARASLRLERVAEAVSWLPDEAAQRPDVDHRNT
jgi:hypothetical protein